MRHPGSMIAALVALTITANSCTVPAPDDGSGRGPITLARGRDTTGGTGPIRRSE
jgi:hypothetical protein